MKDTTKTPRTKKNGSSNKSEIHKFNIKEGTLESDKENVKLSILLYYGRQLCIGFLIALAIYKGNSLPLAGLLGKPLWNQIKKVIPNRSP